jgi:hypothetical protein
MSQIGPQSVTSSNLPIKTKEELVNELVTAVYNVCRASLGDALLRANQQLPIARQAVLDRMK